MEVSPEERMTENLYPDDTVDQSMIKIHHTVFVLMVVTQYLTGHLGSIDNVMVKIKGLASGMHELRGKTERSGTRTSLRPYLTRN